MVSLLVIVLNWLISFLSLIQTKPEKKNSINYNINLIESNRCTDTLWLCAGYCYDDINGMGIIGGCT